jgi:hypothetical protein
VEEIKTARFGTYGRGAWEFKLYQDPVGIQNQYEQFTFDLYPNPATEIVNIKLNAFLPNAIISVYDMNGDLVINKNAALNNNMAYHLNIQNLPAGNYFVKIKDGQKEFTQKMIVVK